MKINKFPGDLTDVSAKKEPLVGVIVDINIVNPTLEQHHSLWQCFCFQKVYNLFFRYFDTDVFFRDNANI